MSFGFILSLVGSFLVSYVAAGHEIENEVGLPLDTHWTIDPLIGSHSIILNINWRFLSVYFTLLCFAMLYSAIALW